MNFCSTQLSFELIIEDSWLIKFHHVYWDDLKKNIFSFIIQSQHFIVRQIHQKRIHCKEMDWELWITKISTIFKKHSIFFIISKTQLDTLYDKTSIQSISVKEWYYVSMVMSVGDLFESTWWYHYCWYQVDCHNFCSRQLSFQLIIIL